MINVAGIRFSVHPLFVIIMLTSIFTGRFLELIALFAIVFVHEMGHVVAARALGVKVMAVQMLPFGGMALLEDRGHMGAHSEIIIAAAGPLQNLLLIIITIIFRWTGVWDSPFAVYFIECNVFIALFNLLPILPLDGGKICQALCSMSMPYHSTLLWCSRISVVFSCLVVGYALLPWILYGGALQLNILLIGSFLLYSNIMDHRHIPFRFLRFLMHRDQAFTRHLLRGSLVQPIITEASKPLDTLLRLLRREKYHFIYVMNPEGQIVAVVPEQKVITSFLSGTPRS
ncbi:stage IV sporulation protein FB [Paenibacillus shirakamiensis]|uniref:Stage IV sporulation protein FB n=1 Tax=Paenibacillus shirakamiensis TaxID=1265935 RepID=A0ABS4JHG5_9BACL|nr:M50 family metallopeptidase [Paenibacillus shirakamiensis]MBP2000396.1 stage IV sporulation protein FB [Paenibacillus shirakamiensis]